MALGNKKLKASDPTQQTLVLHAGSMSCTPVTVRPIDSANEEAQKNVNENDNNLTATGLDMKSPKVVRKWNDKWMKLYSWLGSDIGEEGGRYMFCQICTDGGKFNALHRKNENKNFQNSTLSRHADLDEHKLSLQAPKLRSDMNIVLKKGDSKKDAAATVLLTLVPWLAIEDMPFTKYESLLKLLLSFSPEELDSLKILKSQEDIENQNKPSDAEEQMRWIIIHELFLFFLKKDKFNILINLSRTNQ